MLPVLMNYVFVLAVGIFLGTVSAFEIFQHQLEKEIKYYNLCKFFGYRILRLD